MNEINQENDDYIEGYFDKPLNEDDALELHVAIGFRRGNGLMMKNRKCVGFICHKDDLDIVKRRFPIH